MAGGFFEKIKDMASDLAYVKKRRKSAKAEMTFYILAAVAFIFNLLLVLEVFGSDSIMSGCVGIAVVFMGVANLFNTDGYYASHIIIGITLIISGVILTLTEFYVLSGGWVIMLYVSIIVLGIIASSITTLVLSRRGIR